MFEFLHVLPWPLTPILAAVAARTFFGVSRHCFNQAKKIRSQA